MDSNREIAVTSSTSSFAKNTYIKLVNSWIDYQINKKANSRANFLAINYFQSNFIHELRRQFKCQIVSDNVAADVLLEMLSNRIRFWRGLQHSSSLETEQCSSQAIRSITKTLRKQKFITKRKQNDLISILNDELGTPSQQGIHFIAQTLLLGPTPEENKLSLWNKYMPVKISEFWKELINEYPELESSQAIRNIYEAYQGIIKKKVSPQNFQKLSIRFQRKSRRAEYLQKIADSFDFFKSSKAAKVHEQVQAVREFIVNSLSHSSTSYIQVEPYGSYCSHFCQLESDVDLAIMIINGNEINQQRAYIQKKLWNVFHTIKKYKEAIHCSQLRPIINDRIKVPFVLVQFEPTHTLKSVDLVLNNINGVKNSRFLFRYSQNETIKRLGLLIKKWGKQHSLISKFRLSSYGVLLLMLFYLIKTGNLDYLEPEALVDARFDFPNTLKKQRDLFKLYKGFFDFYDRDGPFFSQDKMLCLIKGCWRNHDSLAKQQYVINMHDPFDNTNPGRLKQKDRFCFYNAVALTQDQLGQITEAKAQEIQYLFRKEEKPKTKFAKVINVDDDDDFI